MNLIVEIDRTNEERIKVTMPTATFYKYKDLVTDFTIYANEKLNEGYECFASELFV